MGLKFLLKKKAELVSAMKALLSLAEAEDRPLTDAEEKDLTAKSTEKAQLDSQIKLIQGINLEDDAEPATRVVTAKASSGNPTPGGPSPKKDFDSLDEFMEAVIAGKDDQRLEYKEYQSEQRMDTGSAGGFMVPTQFRDQILSVDPAMALVRPRAQVIPAGSPPDGEILIPALEQSVLAGEPRVFGGVTVYKVDEGGTKTETEGKLRVISLKPSEMAARIPFTDKLLRNWAAASGWAGNLLRGAVVAFEDTQFLTGNGVGGPKGVIDAASTYQVTRAVAAQIALSDIKEIYARFMGNEATALWVCSYSAFQELLSIVGDGGGATNIINVNQATGEVRIYGILVMRHPRVRGLGEIGDIGLYDFSSYLIKDGSGPIVEVGFATGQWEANKRSIKLTWNVDGKSWLTEPYQDEEAFPKSPVVVLGLP